MSVGSWIFLGIAVVAICTMRWWFPALMKNVEAVRRFRSDPRNVCRSEFGEPDYIRTSHMTNRAGMMVFSSVGNDQVKPVGKEIWVYKKLRRKVCFALVPGLGKTKIRKIGEGNLTELFYWTED